ncbi:MAG TPA: Hsp33 family molecular chaperone HslO [Polyangia bacterium]|nr:Hsp33 family molecular chaperone HslO [Polyangia bacterium]
MTGSTGIKSGSPGAHRDVGDHILRAVWDGGAARVVAAITTATAREAVRRHGASDHAALALARGATAGLLLATLTKDDERVTLQVLGDGPLAGITVDARSSGGVRAYVKNLSKGVLAVRSGERASLAEALGTGGVVSVIRDLGLKENVRGQTPLVAGELDTDVEHYLNTSEQIDSALGCDALFVATSTAIVASGGILVQALPGSAGSAFIERARACLRSGALARALAAQAAPSAEALARAVLAEVEPAAGGAALQLLDVRPVRFECPCSRERAAGSLALLGGAELAAMIVEDGKAEVICNFCRERYDFSERDLDSIRREIAPSGSLPS